MQLDGTITVLGTAAAPRFYGSIDILEGYLNYVDRRFAVKEGTVDFISPLRFNPRFNIQSRTEVSAYAAGADQVTPYAIDLTLSGDLQHPVITFTSDPPLSEPAIISVLTLGTTSGGVGGDLTNRLASLAGQTLLGFGTRPLEKLLDLDNIAVSGNLFGTAGNQTGPQLSVTKQFSRRLTVTYTTDIGQLSHVRLNALYRITSFLFLNGTTDQLGLATLILQFRYSH